MNRRLQALGRLKAGQMNNTELAYRGELALRKQRGEVEEFWFEGITLRLAADTRYTPDFLVLLPNGELELHEVKGFWTDDAWVKTKIAAERFPFRVVVVKKLTKTEGGGFSKEVL